MEQWLRFYATKSENEIRRVRNLWYNKIWAINWNTTKIIPNKEFYYSEIILNKKDWEEYKKWGNENWKNIIKRAWKQALFFWNRQMLNALVTKVPENPLKSWYEIKKLLNIYK